MPQSLQPSPKLIFFLFCLDKLTYPDRVEKKGIRICMYNQSQILEKMGFELSSCLGRVSLALTKILGSEYLEENLFSVDSFLMECDVPDCTLWKKTSIF